MEDLLVQLRVSRTDLARIVEAASRTELPFIVVPAGAIRAWEEREPSAWGKARDWLTEQGKAIVEREEHRLDVDTDRQKWIAGDQGPIGSAGRVH